MDVARNRVKKGLIIIAFGNDNRLNARRHNRLYACIRVLEVGFVYAILGLHNQSVVVNCDKALEGGIGFDLFTNKPAVLASASYLNKKHDKKLKKHH